MVLVFGLRFLVPNERLARFGCHKLFLLELHSPYHHEDEGDEDGRGLKQRRYGPWKKGRELDVVFASFTVDKGAKRLSSKMKAYLAEKVDTSVDSIQAYWMCFRRNNLKMVRRTVLFLLWPTL